MAKLTIDTGSVGNPATGDTLRTAMTKVNSNFDDVYQLVGDGSTGLLTTSITNGDLKLQANGTGAIEIDTLSITNSTITSVGTNSDITITPNGTGNLVLGALTVRGTTLSSADSSKITLAESVDITGNLVVGGSFDLSGLAVGTLDVDNLNFNDNIISSDSNSDINITPGGTGDVVAGAIRIHGTTLSADDSTVININEGLVVDGTTTVSGALSSATSLALATGATVTGIDNGTLGSSATLLATQGAIKTYVDAQDANIASDTLTFTNKTFNVEGTGNSISNIDVADLKSGVLDTDLTSVSGSDDTLASAKAIKTYVDAQVTAQDLDITADDSTALSIDLDTETLHFAGDTGITTTVSGNTVTHAIDGTVATLAGSQTLTNKSIDFDNNTVTNIEVDNLKAGVLDTDITSVAGTDTTLASAKAIKTYVDSQVTAQDLDFATDDSTALSIDLDSEVLQVSGGANITTSGSANTITIALDTALTGLSSVTSTAIVTNNISSSDSTAVRIDDALNVDGALDVGAGLTISNGTSITAILDEDGMGSDSATSLATQQSIKAYADTKAVLSGSTNNQITTVTGAHAIQGESNLTFDGSTLAVTGAGTFGGVLTATSVTSNDFTSNGSNADINITPAGTGGVVITSGGVAFTLPTADGSSGDVLKTDGSGTLTFASSTATPSDDTRVVVKNNKSVSTSARTMDYFQSTSADLAWYFVALNDLTNDHSSASCFAVAHNDSDAFISGARGGASGSDNSLPTTSADISSGQVRVKIAAPSADSKISYYKIPISRANTADATAGVTVTTSNTDVDSASESIDTFAHASFRAAKYLIIIDDNAKTETGVTEALVVHDGTNAFVTQHGTINTGNNDMITLSAAISGSNVVLSAAGLTTNLSLKIHKTLLADSMTAVSNANQKIIGATTVSSSATAFDSFDLDDATAAMYYVVGGNATEGHYSVQEVYCAGAPGEASVSHGPFVSTKGTVQLNFTAAFDADEDNTLQMSISSTSGGSTTVNAYRINCLAE